MGGIATATRHLFPDSGYTGGVPCLSWGGRPVAMIFVIG